MSGASIARWSAARDELALLQDACQRRRVREHACRLFTVLGAAGDGQVASVRSSWPDRARGDASYGAVPLVRRGHHVLGARSRSSGQAAGIGDEDAAPAWRARIGPARGEDDAGGRGRAACRRRSASRAASRPRTRSSWARAAALEARARRAARGRARRPPLGRADAARPRRAPRRMVTRRADPPGLHRPAGAARRPARTARRSTLRLEPLSDPDAATLIDNLIGEARARSGGVRERVLEAAAGVPLFVEELLAILVEDGLVRQAADGRGLAAAASRDSRSRRRSRRYLPGASTDWRRASERCSRTARSRGSFPPRGCRRARRRDGRPGVAVARRPPRARARPTRRRAFFDETAYSFRHILIRDAAYRACRRVPAASCTSCTRAGWREGGRAGNRYEEVLGYHFEQAYRYGYELGLLDERAQRLGASAAAHLSASGRRALAREDVFAGANLLGRSASLLATDDPTRDDLLLELGSALVFAGDFVRADAVLSEAIEAGRGVAIDGSSCVALSSVRSCGRSRTGNGAWRI